MPLPPQVPLVTYFSPNKADQGLIEIWSAEVANYQALDVGSRHPNSRDYPNFKLGKQSNLPTDHRFVIRTWVTDETSPEWWNFAEKFSADSNSHPVFVRTYREPRKTYAPLTKGQPLKSVYKLSLSTAGTGYTVGTLPALTFTNTGTGGTGAAGHAIVAPDGTISHLVLDDGGDGYNTAPTFTIAAPPEGGTTATGTALIQPATALLVAEEAQQFPDDSEFRGLYLNVVRVYETLPGPTLPYTRFDDDLGPVQGYRQAVLWANQTPALTATGKTTYEARDGSSIVAWKIVEAWSTGEGTPENPAYPIGKADFYDNERGAVHQTSQITTDTTSPGSLTVSGGIATLIRYEPFQENPALRKKIVETWAVPGPTLRTQERYDKDLGKITGTRQLVENTGQTQTATATVQTRYDESKYGAALVWKIIESWSMPGPVHTSTEFEKDGVKKVVTRQLMATGSVVTDETLSAGTLTRKFGERYNEFLSFQIVETITVIDADLLDLPSFTTSIPNLIPEIFRALIPTHIESHIEEGTAAEPALATGEFEHSERQLTPLYKEVRSTVLDDIGALPITITGLKETNAQKQVVTVAMKLCVDSTTPTVPTALIDVDFRKLGNGLAIEITKTIPNVFDGDTRSIEIPDVAPAWAKALLPTTQTSSEAAATSVSDPTLSAGQLRKTVRRTTEKTVETQITARDVASLPKTRTNKRLTTEFGGGAVDEVQTQASGSQSISSGGLLVLDSEMEVLGDGTSVLKTSTQTDGSWPILSDYDIDEETGQTILTTYQVVAAASAGTATISSGVVTRYKHIDKWRSLKIIATYSTPAMYEEQRFGAHNFPTLWDGDYHWSSECGAFATGFRGGFSAMVRMRTEVSFSTSKAADIDGLTLIPKTLLMGKGVQLPADLIMDSGSFVYSGTCSGTVSFGASDPDYSTYIGSIQNTEQLITGESVKMGKAGMYRNTNVYVYML